MTLFRVGLLASLALIGCSPPEVPDDAIVQAVRVIRWSGPLAGQTNTGLSCKRTGHLGPHELKFLPGESLQSATNAWSCEIASAVRIVHSRAQEPANNYPSQEIPDGQEARRRQV